MSDSFQPQDGLGPLHRHLHRLHPTCPLPLRTRQEGSKSTTWKVDRMERVFFVPQKNNKDLCLSCKVIAPLNPGLVKTALNEAIAAADLCGCCFELIISEFLCNKSLSWILDLGPKYNTWLSTVADNYGLAAYGLYLFLLTIWWSMVIKILIETKNNKNWLYEIVNTTNEPLNRNGATQLPALTTILKSVSKETWAGGHEFLEGN